MGCGWGTYDASSSSPQLTSTPSCYNGHGPPLTVVEEETVELITSAAPSTTAPARSPSSRATLAEEPLRGANATLFPVAQSSHHRATRATFHVPNSTETDLQASTSSVPIAPTTPPPSDPGEVSPVFTEGSAPSSGRSCHEPPVSSSYSAQDTAPTASSKHMSPSAPTLVPFDILP